MSIMTLSIDAAYFVLMVLLTIGTTKMGTTIQMVANPSAIFSVPVIRLSNAKGLDIHGCMKQILFREAKQNGKISPVIIAVMTGQDKKETTLSIPQNMKED